MIKLIDGACTIDDINEVCKKLGMTYEELIFVAVRNFMNWMGYDTD